MNRPTQSGPSPALVVLLASLLAAPALGQSRSTLSEQLEDLNIRLTTDHYVLAGTVTDERMQEYGNALEWIYREYEKGFGELMRQKERRDTQDRRSGRVPPATAAQQEQLDEPGSIADADEEKYRVIIFATNAEYLEFGDQFVGSNEHTRGKFIPSHNLLLILDQGDQNETYQILFHEAFHQFFRRYVKDPPVWLNEGLATHYGYARPTRTGLSFARPPANRWKLVRDLMQQRKAIPLHRIVTASRAEFYNAQPFHVDDWVGVTRKGVYYAQAYTLVHALLNDRDGRKYLQKYVLALAADDGTNTRKITEEYFSQEMCDKLVDGWVKHVRSNPERR